MGKLEQQLWKACSKGRVEKAQKLLQSAKINTNWQDPHFLRTPFFRACYQGQTEIVKLLLNDKRVDVNKVGIGRWTPLHTACDRGHIDIVELLLNDERVEINKIDHDGDTAFFIACFRGHHLIVKYILACGRGVDLTIKDNEEKTAIDIAREGEKTEQIRWKMKNIFNKEKKNYRNIVELLESFEMNPHKTRETLRIQLGLAGIYHFSPLLFLLLFP